MSEKSQQQRGRPSQPSVPYSQPSDPGQEVYDIPFTIQEIDRIMAALIELNVPVRTWFLLDSKFARVRQEAALKRGAQQLKEFRQNNDKGADNGPGEVN